MQRFKNILYVLEPMADQRTAFERAVALAEENQARLTVLDVVPEAREWLNLLSDSGEAIRIRQDELERHQEEVESLVQPYRERLTIETRIEEGKLFLAAIQAVLRHGYDLVVKPVENPEWVDRIFGSQDMHLLRKCPAALWLIKPSWKSRFENILAAVDIDPAFPDAGTDELNLRILELASSVALAELSSLHILHVWDAPEVGFFERWADRPEEARLNFTTNIHNQHRQGLEALCDNFKARIGEETYDFIAPRIHLRQGKAEQLIPRFAAQLTADLVVMGTVGRSGIPGLFIGNTAEMILEKLDCSVLALKPAGFVSPIKAD